MRVNHGDVPEGAVFAGVDTHADAHWLCVLDAVGRPLLSEAFPATPEGYDALAAAVIPSTFFSPIAQMNRHRSRQRIFTGSANGLSPFSAILRPSSRAAGPSAGRTCP